MEALAALAARARPLCVFYKTSGCRKGVPKSWAYPDKRGGCLLTSATPLVQSNCSGRLTGSSACVRISTLTQVCLRVLHTWPLVLTLGITIGTVVDIMIGTIMLTTKSIARFLSA